MDGHYKKLVSIFIMAIILILLFSYFIYPTRFKYLDYGDGVILMRIDRITGDVQMYDRKTGQWEKYIR